MFGSSFTCWQGKLLPNVSSPVHDYLFPYQGQTHYFGLVLQIRLPERFRKWFYDETPPWIFFALADSYQKSANRFSVAREISSDGCLCTANGNRTRG